MKRYSAIFLGLVLFAMPLAAQDPTATWNTVSQPVFDGERSASVTNLVIERDRVKLTLVNGMLQFAQPASGRVFAAVFNGSGRIEVIPPNANEAHQLRVNSGQISLNMEFNEATFTFSDETFEEISKKVTLAGGGSAQAGEIYRKRQTEREDVGAEMVPRIFKSLLSKDRKRTSFFGAEVKTREKNWVLAQVDALEQEEIRVGRFVNWGPVTRFDIWMQFPAGGVSSAETFRDPMAREDFKIDRYRINSTVTNSAELTAETKVSLTNRAAGETVFLFELDANLRAESVKDEKGTALAFFQPKDPKDRNQSYGDYIAVVLPQPTAANQAQTLEFRYAGKRVVRKEGSGNFFCQSYGWYPSRPNSFAARSDFELNFKSPKRYTLVATGNKINATTDGDWAISTWKSDLPLAVAGFAYGDYKIITEKVGDIDIEVYANKEGDDVMKAIQNAAEGGNLPTQGSHSAIASVGTLTPAGLAKPMAIEMANTLRVFEAYFGPYPYKRLAVSSLPLAYSYGQGWPTLIYLASISFLDSQQRHSLGVQDHVQLTDFFRAHESSHQWWGHRVGWKSYHDQWLSEGFAEFSGNLYVQFRKGEKELTTRLKQDREILRSAGDDKTRLMESLGPIWMGTRLSTADARQAYSLLIYSKGGYVLSMLRMMMFDSRAQAGQNPEQRFQTMMKDFTQTYNNKAASTEDFKAIVEKYMTSAMDLDQNKKMDWFFNQYVYGTGIPEYHFRYNVEPTPDGKFKISGTIARSGVRDGWKDSLPVYMVQGGRTLRLGWIATRSATENFEFTMASKPERLVLNANEDILAEIKQ